MLNTALQVYQFTLDSAIAEWIARKGVRSQKTAAVYDETLRQFRQFLQVQAQGYDLDSPAGDIARIVALWANSRVDELTSKGKVAPLTYNQRLAIISSFYSFLQKTYQLDIPNPITLVDKLPPHAQDAAQPLDLEDITYGLDLIDRSTKEGLRDYAMLAVTLATGRRATEVTSLRWKDVQIKGRRKEMQITLKFMCKGQKPKEDTLDPETSGVVLDYVHAEYGKDVLRLSLDAPLWVSYSRRNPGQGVSAKTLSNICKRYLETGKVHALRHTFAVESEKAGAPISDISFRLGHSSEAITSRYLLQKRSAENPLGKELASRFGIHRKGK